MLKKYLEKLKPRKKHFLEKALEVGSEIKIISEYFKILEIKTVHELAYHQIRELVNKI